MVAVTVVDGVEKGIHGAIEIFFPILSMRSLQRGFVGWDKVCSAGHYNATRGGLGGTTWSNIQRNDG